MLNDLVGIIVENILFKTGASVCEKIDSILKNKGIIFTACYKNPQILLAALRCLPDDTHVSVVYLQLKRN